MDNKQEMVLVEKAVLEDLLTTVKELKKQLDDIQDAVDDCYYLIGPMAEKMGTV